MMKKTKSRQKEAGFTLIEIIVVIVVLGLLGVMGGDFISQAMKGFVQTGSRLELYEEGKSMLAKMERELHDMLPNGICVTNNGGASCVADGTAGNEVLFGMIAENSMRVNKMVGKYTESVEDILAEPEALTDKNGTATPPVGSVVSVYNSSWVDFSSGNRLHRISAASGAGMTLGSGVDSPSPHGRYYLVNRGVSYKYDGAAKKVVRKTVAVSATGVGSFSGAVAYPMALDVTDCRFYYAHPSLARNGIVSMVLTLSKNGEEIQMHKEIHVKNVP